MVRCVAVRKELKRMAIKKLQPNKWLVKASVWSKSKNYPIAKQATVNGTRADAVMAESDMLKELRARSLTSEYASTFGEAVDLYVRKIRMRGKLSTGYELMIAHVRRELGHVRLEVFAERFDVYRNHLMRAKTSAGKVRKNASVNRYTAIVRAVFNHLVDLELIVKNPINKVRFPILEERPRDRMLSQEERLRLINAIRQHRPYILPIIEYMLAVPCRVSELTSALRTQYNHFTGTIYIPDSKAGIPIHKPIPEEMREYFNSIPDDCQWLFYQKTGQGKYRPLTNLRYAWAYCLKQAEITDYRIHDLRHEAATALYEAGNQTRVIMDIAGWKTDMLTIYRNKHSLRSAQKIVFGQTPPEALETVYRYKTGCQ
jgi:integrase